MVKLTNNSDKSATDLNPFENAISTGDSKVVDDHGHLRCPYLGLKSDPATTFNYPSNWNICYRAKPAMTPQIDHQQNVCLTPYFSECPVYKSETRIKLPDDISQPTQNRKNPKLIILLVIIAIILLSVFIIFSLPTINNWLGRNPTITHVSTPYVTQNMSLPVVEPTIDQTIELALITPEIIETKMTVTKTATITSIPTPIRRLDIPIGGDQKFVVHQVLEGESLEQYATMYGTTREIIVETNYLLPIPLWVNWLVVIPVNLIEIKESTTFEAYIVTQDQITSSALAEKLAIKLTDLELYNALKPAYTFHSGDVVIIPREGHFFDY